MDGWWRSTGSKGGGRALCQDGGEGYKKEGDLATSLDRLSHQHRLFCQPDTSHHHTTPTPTHLRTTHPPITMHTTSLLALLPLALIVATTTLFATPATAACCYFGTAQYCSTHSCQCGTGNECAARFNLSPAPAGCCPTNATEVAREMMERWVAEAVKMGEA